VFSGPKADLTRQIETQSRFCFAQGIKIDRVFSDVASGINARKTVLHPTRFSA